MVLPAQPRPPRTPHPGGRRSPLLCARLRWASSPAGLPNLASTGEVKRGYLKKKKKKTKEEHQHNSIFHRDKALKQQQDLPPPPMLDGGQAGPRRQATQPKKAPAGSGGTSKIQHTRCKPDSLGCSAGLGRANPPIKQRFSPLQKPASSQPLGSGWEGVGKGERSPPKTSR